MNTESNAMTEVALALAMAFFAIFVLAAVSMGLPAVEETKTNVEKISTIEFTATGAQVRTLSSEETLIIYYRRRYYDADLAGIDINDLPSGKSFVLAVSPQLPLSEVLEAKNAFGSRRSIVTMLSKEWLGHLGK